MLHTSMQTERTDSKTTPLDVQQLGLKDSPRLPDDSLSCQWVSVCGRNGL
jgi:hypothetical protein